MQARRARSAAARDLRDEARIHLRVGGRRSIEHARGRNARVAPARSGRFCSATARRLAGAHRARCRRDRHRYGRAAVGAGGISTDTWGRPWRQGTPDVAIGAAGVQVMLDLSGEHDPIGYQLKATFITIADKTAGAAQLASGKLGRVPVTVVRGLDVRGTGRATDIPVPPELDLFR